jgi:hypothetical protein
MYFSKGAGNGLWSGREICHRDTESRKRDERRKEGKKERRKEEKKRRQD